MSLRLLRSAALLLGLGHALPGPAAELNLLIEDAGRGPVADAVVFLMPESGDAPAGGPASAVMDQISLEYAPHVLAVRRNTAVRFPNRDDVRHHVYSFSPAKRFELRLYKGTPSEPVVFERNGPVVLGCNIHDWMLGYIYVVDTPWYGQTPLSGRLSLTVPPGRYTLNVWHPRLTDIQTPRSQPLVLDAGGTAVKMALPLKTPTLRKRPEAGAATDRFRSYR